MSLIVAKFGGSSLCDAARFQNVAQILTSSPERRYVVASAPGRRFEGDDKVTDLLYRCHALAREGRAFDEELAEIRRRFEDIAGELHLNCPVGRWLEEDAACFSKRQADFAASRGEALCARLLAKYLKWEWIDAAQTIFFDSQGCLDEEKTNEALSRALKAAEYAVIPGFYGSMPDGRIKTFSRGGSDVTGALVARAAGAHLYENWTDVPGVLAADPRIVHNPRRIETLTYRELRSLSCMGASVVHEDAVLPVRNCATPVHVRSSLQPGESGTRIVPYAAQRKGIRGVAGKKGFYALNLELTQERQAQCVQQVLDICANQGQPVEKILYGMDSLCLILKRSTQIQEKELRRAVGQCPGVGRIDAEKALALVGVVGSAVERSAGNAARFASALEKAQICPYFLQQCPGTLCLVAGVEEMECEGAIRALHQALIEERT